MSGVLVIIKADDCGHCRNLTAILPKILKAIKDKFPTLQIEVIATPAMKKTKSFIVENGYPEQLGQYSRWFPMIILVPQGTWDKADDMKKGVQIMNGMFDKAGEIAQNPNCDFRDKDKFVAWIDTAMKNEDYIKYSVSSSKKSNPLLKSIAVTTPVEPKYVAAGPLTSSSSETTETSPKSILKISENEKVRTVSNKEKKIVAPPKLCDVHRVSRKK